MKRVRHLCLALGLILAGTGAAAASDPLEASLLGELQSARTRAGVAPLERRAELDAAAAERARRISRRPAGQRLSESEPIDAMLRRQGVVSFRRARVHVDLKRGYLDYGEAYLSTWRTQRAAWSEALSASNQAIGLAVRTTDDGWVVLVAVLLEDELPREPPDLEELEREALRRVNEVRSARGRRNLVFNARLAEVARSHSRDMARRNYFDHVSTGGAQAKQRVGRAGVEWSRLGENLQVSRGVEDPVESAVSSWLSSRGHRKVMLDPDFTETGVGVAVGDEGRIYFTQLFILP